MFRRWKENGRKALLAMQAAVLSRMMTICSYAETVQDETAEITESSTGAGQAEDFLRKRSRRCRMCSEAAMLLRLWWQWDFLCCCLSMQA